MIIIKTNLVIFVFIAGLSLAGNIAMLVSASFFKLATTTFEAVTNIPSVALNSSQGCSCKIQR